MKLYLTPIRLSIIVLVLGFGINLNAKDIKSIQFEGLKKTNATWLASQLYCKTGQVFDQALFDKDIQYIKDLNLFLGVVGYTTESDGGYNLRIVIKEAIYLYPILSIEKAGDKYRGKLGASYDHFLGMKSKIGGFVSYYDKLSFVFYHDMPIHFNQKTGHYFSVSRRASVEPVKHEGGIHDIDFSLFTIGGGAYYHWRPRLTSNFGIQYFREAYLTQYTGSPLYNDGKDVPFNKFQISTGLKWDKTHYTEELLSGFYSEFNIEYIKTLEFEGNDGNFFKSNFVFKYFRNLFNKKDNLAFRFQFGIASNGNIPIPPFVIDNFTNVRGAGDRVLRGTGEVGFNFEYRFRVWKNPYFYLQAVAFTDATSLRPRLSTFEGTFKKSNLIHTGGVGLRMQLRKFYHIVLRVDYSIGVSNARDSQGLLFGVGQFF